ncbi:DUF1007 family protein [Halarcobacter anaerophilus]|jgi:ABC-type uncharacterized transport system substrate-binding protein|uniref:DUF1007 family protein n=1 Tax=Halarcobacter anaerophilus TaxID=877500 RepID=UPI0005CA2A41|nr:DUF1007 family protein [Halarcobacter anaerophilus]
MKLFFILFFTFIPVFAHPHYFLDSSIEIEKNMIKNHWKFDLLNSKILMFDFDTNRNKKLDKKEKEEFLKINFYNLKKNNFNIFLADDINEYKIEPKNVDLKYEKRRLTISFDIDYTIKNSITFCTMDEKIYLAYKLKNLNTKYNTQIQKSEYDFCIGVSK